MLKWLFGFFNRPTHRPTHTNPPTEKQLSYARRLGIKIPEGIDKEGLSELISVKNLGGDIAEQKQKWDKHAEAGKWMLVVFSKGSSRHAEIVRINGVSISKTNKLILDTEVIKITKESSIGEFLDIDKYLEIPLGQIMWFEIINEIDIRNTKQFKTLAERLQKQLQEIKLPPSQ